MEGVAPSPPLLFSHLCSRQHSRIVAATLGLLGKQALIRRVNRVHPSCPSSHRSFSFSFDPSPPFSFPRNIELPRKSRASKGLPSSDSHTTRGGGRELLGETRACLEAKGTAYARQYGLNGQLRGNQLRETFSNFRCDYLEVMS